MRESRYYSQVMPLLEDVLSNQEENLALYLSYMIHRICEYLGIKTRISLSSDIRKTMH